LIAYPFSIIVPALKVKFRIYPEGLSMINIAHLTTGLAIRTLPNVLKGRNKYPWEHTSKNRGESR
jgi:hypothetical protein